MKHGRKVAICLAGGLALHTGAVAAATGPPGNPYSVIVAKNVFALKPLPRQPTSSESTLTPLRKIILTGIVKCLCKKQVFFKTSMAAKPGEPLNETTFMLSEGECAGEIEILEINETAGTVRVKNQGFEQALSLEKDGMKPPGSVGLGSVPLSVMPRASMSSLVLPAVNCSVPR